MDREQDIRQRYTGRRIAGVRRRRGLTQRKLAELADVTQSAINNWENGARAPRWDELRRLAAALEVEASWLIDPLVCDFGQLPGEDSEDG